jgi:hypothetical protein
VTGRTAIPGEGHPIPSSAGRGSHVWAPAPRRNARRPRDDDGRRACEPPPSRARTGLAARPQRLGAGFCAPSGGTSEAALRSHFAPRRERGQGTADPRPCDTPRREARRAGVRRRTPRSVRQVRLRFTTHARVAARKATGAPPQKSLSATHRGPPPIFGGGPRAHRAHGAVGAHVRTRLTETRASRRSGCRRDDGYCCVVSLLLQLRSESGV